MSKNNQTQSFNGEELKDNVEEKKEKSSKPKFTHQLDDFKLTSAEAENVEKAIKNNEHYIELFRDGKKFFLSLKEQDEQGNTVYINNQSVYKKFKKLK
jgi:hypothetical protein